ncbi:uncharacterized protein LOC132057887 [Lycium ferocissimum]|uniref:uncharacterized protein LOC132057887 n=1 Tax=Lycium ferocissimum TaxID=112874 RepID=UPI00281510A3|nr:uncharacterized protein LOC132057887 [Lycium ferocissimum]
MSIMWTIYSLNGRRIGLTRLVMQHSDGKKIQSSTIVSSKFQSIAKEEEDNCLDTDSHASIHLEQYGGPSTGKATGRLQFSEAATSAQPTPTEKPDFKANRLAQKDKALTYVPPITKDGKVIFPGLPIDFWSSEALGKVTSAIGRPMYTDKFTANMEKLSYARVLIEIDVAQPLLGSIKLETPTEEVTPPTNQPEEPAHKQGNSTPRQMTDQGKPSTASQVDSQQGETIRPVNMANVEGPCASSGLNITERCIHCKGKSTTGFSTFRTVVYAKNEVDERISLWRDLEQFGSSVQGPWILSGDFNTLLSSEDRLGSPQDNSRVYSKIDWVLGNLHWLQAYGYVEAESLNPGVSNHSSALIQYKAPEKELVVEITKWSVVEEQALRQKSRENWITNGDANISYFHAQCRIRANRNAITSIHDVNGTKLTDPDQIEAEFLSFFTNLLGTTAKELPYPNSVTIRKEILDAIKEIPHEKASGVDGFPIEFFSKNWGIVQHDMTQAIKEFFHSGKILQAFSGTAITLVPKVSNPTQVDLRKAYDSIERSFLQHMMAELGFPHKFIMWIMECLSSVSYALVINGGLTKTFKEKRGIRQGDLMSPYLFVIAMEYLQREFNLLTSNQLFKYHPRCKRLGVVHICFAYDLLMFCKADLPSIGLLQEAFARFSAASGLQANADKSSIYMSGVKAELK